MKRREREEACPICGHYHDYEGGEPCGICGHRLDHTGPCDVHPPSVLPTEVIPGFLFLGSYDHVSRSDLLKTLGIDHILNTVPTCPNLYKNSFDYHSVTSSPASFEECFHYIESVRQKPQGGKVIVHCMSGNSRSPAIVAYYFMRMNRCSLDQALAYIQSKRPSVVFKEDDLNRLRVAELELFQGQFQGQQQQAAPFGGAFQWGPAPVGVNGNGSHGNGFNAAAPQVNFFNQGAATGASGFVFGAPHPH